MDPIDICEASALKPFVGCLERRGIGADRYLECQGIPPELVAAGRGKIFKRKAWDFLADVSKREGIETLGVLDGDAFSCDELGALGDSLQQAVTLQDAIDTFRRLVTTFAEGNTVWIERGPEISWLCSRTSRLDPAAHVPNDFSLLVLVALVRMVAGPDWRPLALRCQTQPTRTGRELADFSDLETTYLGNSSAIALPSALLAEPPSPSSRPTPPVPATGTSEALRQVLASLLEFQCLPTIEGAGEMLGVSRRTLLRALESDGLTYRHLVDRVRFEAASRMLGESDASVTETAYHLGYSSPSNFVRAFRRMTGLSPGEYRRRTGENVP
jgi:AraC-like DNA-binding protein